MEKTVTINKTTQLPEVAELIVQARASSLNQGLTADEFALIRAAVEQARANGQKLSIRFRLEETEEELIKQYGDGDKNKAVQALSEKFRTFIPGGTIGGIFGVSPKGLKEELPIPPTNE